MKTYRGLLNIFIAILFLVSCSDNTKYTVTFKDNDKLLFTQMVKKYKTIKIPSTPKKEGYEFVEWRNNKGEKFDLNKNITKDLSLKVLWKKKTYEVEFDTYGGTVIDAMKFDYGVPLDSIKNPIKRGYKFKGWKINGEFIKLPYNLTSNVVLEAEWKKIIYKPIKRYLVTFNTNGGNEIKDTKIRHGRILKDKFIPKKEGYKFIGWEDNNGNLISNKDKIFSDLNLNAVWKKEYYIYLNIDEVTTDKILVNKGDIISSYELKVPSKENYRFLNWSIEGEDNILDDCYEINSNISLIPNWIHKDSTLTYSVFFQDDENIDTTIVEEYSIVQRPKDPKKEGYTFISWEMEGDTLEFDFCSEVISNITLIAKWEEKDEEEKDEEEKDEEEKELIQISFKNGEDIITSEIEVGSTVKMPRNPKKEGYKFMGWYEEENGNDDDEDKDDDENEEDEEEEDDDDENDDDEDKEENKDEERNGNKEGGKDKEEYKFDFCKNISKEITLTAKWIHIDSLETYNIKLTDKNSLISELTIKEGDRINITNLETPKKEGYKFVKWMENDSTEYNFNKNVASNLNLKAEWIAGDDLEKVTIIFEKVDEDDTELILIEKNTVVEKPIEPKKEGYKFVEWQLNGEKFDFCSRISTNIVLRAKWEEKEVSKESYVVTFVNGDSKIDISVVLGNTVANPEDPAKEGFVFDGWTLDNGEKFDFNSPITSDITLEANYTIGDNI